MYFVDSDLVPSLLAARSWVQVHDKLTVAPRVNFPWRRSVECEGMARSDWDLLGSQTDITSSVRYGKPIVLNDQLIYTRLLPGITFLPLSRSPSHAASHCVRMATWTSSNVDGSIKRGKTEKRIGRCV